MKLFDLQRPLTIWLGNIEIPFANGRRTFFVVVADAQSMVDLRGRDSFFTATLIQCGHASQ